MKEIFSKLLETEVLSADTVKELQEAFDAHLSQEVAAAKATAENEMKLQLAEQFAADRETLIESIDVMTSERLQEELDELRADIARFRDLEAEYAEKLVEARAAIGAELQNDMATLVEKLDAFLEIRLAGELEELREDFVEIRKNDFGRRIYEAVATEFASKFATEEQPEATLSEVQTRLEDVMSALQESETARATLERKIKMAEVLAPLSGKSREVMETILARVETNMLEEGYKTFIGKVLVTEETTPEKEDKVLAEGSSKEAVVEGTVVTGNTAPTQTVLTEEDESATAQASAIARLRTLAGIK